MRDVPFFGELYRRTTAPLLGTSNSRLLVGTGNCNTMSVRFEKLSIAYTTAAKQKEAVKSHSQ